MPDANESPWQHMQQETAQEKPWLSIFERILEVRAELFPVVDAQNDGQNVDDRSGATCQRTCAGIPQELGPIDLQN